MCTKEKFVCGRSKELNNSFRYSRHMIRTHRIRTFSTSVSRSIHCGIIYTIKRTEVARNHRKVGMEGSSMLDANCVEMFEDFF